MSDPVLVLDYQMTMDDVCLRMKRAMRHMRSRWVQKVFALFLLWGAVDSLLNGQFLQGGLLLVFAAQLTIPHLLLVRWMGNQPPMHVRIEIDNTGLHVHYPQQKSRSGFWWSRLTGVEEVDGDFELRFDGKSYPEMYVPACAFNSQEQRETFLSLVEKHLPHPAADRAA